MVAVAKKIPIQDGKVCQIATYFQILAIHSLLFRVSIKRNAKIWQCVALQKMKAWKVLQWNEKWIYIRLLKTLLLCSDENELPLLLLLPEEIRKHWNKSSIAINIYDDDEWWEVDKWGWDQNRVQCNYSHIASRLGLITIINVFIKKWYTKNRCRL